MPATGITRIGLLADLAAAVDPSQALVLFAPLEPVIASLPDAPRWLSRDEEERILRLHRGEDRRLNLAAHGLKRFVLGTLFDRQPASFRFTRSRLGRPELASPEGADVNLSHAAGWLAVGATARGRIGVDVERDSGRMDWGALAPSVLHAEEYAEVRAMARDEVQRFCLARWCLKEALTKATGEGLSAGLDTLRPAATRDGWRLRRAGLDLTAALVPLAPDVCGAWALSTGLAARVVVLDPSIGPDRVARPESKISDAA